MYNVRTKGCLINSKDIAENLYAFLSIEIVTPNFFCYNFLTLKNTVKCRRVYYHSSNHCGDY